MEILSTVVIILVGYFGLKLIAKSDAGASVSELVSVSVDAKATEIVIESMTSVINAQTDIVSVKAFREEMRQMSRKAGK